MITFAEYNARLCNKDLQEYFQHLLLKRLERPQDDSVKDVIAELQGVVLPGHLNGKTVIELREQNKIAEDLAQQGKIKESIAVLQQILTVYSEHYFAFYTFGVIAFEQGNYTEALDCFKQAFEYNPFFTDAILRIFDCSVCTGSTSDVSEFLSKALTLQPNDPELLETKRHLENGTYPERLAKYINPPEKESDLKQELLKLKNMLENGNSSEALEKLKVLTCK